VKDNETGNSETEQSGSRAEYSEKVYFSHEDIWTPDIQALNR